MKALPSTISYYAGPASSRSANHGCTATGCHSYNQAILEAVEWIDCRCLCPVAPFDAGPVFQPKAMLALLVHSYAHQVYGSVEIEAALARSMVSEPFGLNTWPDAHMIREFRDANRAAVHQCLASALSILANDKVLDGTLTNLSAVHPTEEANRRLIMAMFTDSMELGENALTPAAGETPQLTV